MERRKILAVMPMRSGSTGIPNKNIIALNGHPLFSYALQTMAKADCADRLIISTDSQNYADIAKRYGAEIPFLRPAALADGKTRLHYVMRHALHYFDALGEKFDAVLSIQPTAPLISQQTLSDLVQRFHETGCDAIGTGTMITHGHPYLAKTMVDSDGTVEDYLSLDEGIPRYPRQVRPDLYFFNGAVFLRDRNLLDQIDDDTNALGNAPRMLVIDEVEGINIDSQMDLAIVSQHMTVRN